MTRYSHYFALAALVAGCTTDDSTAESRVTGRAVYRDAATEHSGAPRQPASPSAQEGATLKLRVEGNGTLSGLDPQCLLDAGGRFEARYTGTLAIGDDGAYAGALASAVAEIVTPSGCAIPELEVNAVGRVVVRAELAASAPNCDAYCAAHARAEAEQSCGASSSMAGCRAAKETQVAASCSASCMQSTRRIVAETALEAGALGQLDDSALRAGAFGDLAVDFTFDRVE